MSFHYTVRLRDGSPVDSSAGGSPLEFEVGTGAMIEGVDDAVRGMSAGEKKTVDVPAAKAYGDRRDELVAKIPAEHAPEGIEVGNRLQLTQEDGSQMIVAVTEIDEDGVTIDGNHPLAGEDLTFDIEIVSVSGGGDDAPRIILP